MTQEKERYRNEDCTWFISQYRYKSKSIMVMQDAWRRHEYAINVLNIRHRIPLALFKVKLKHHEATRI